MASYVAGIVDRGGGFRTVVTENKDDFARYHVGEGERLFILPDTMVQEPVSLADAGPLIDRVKNHIRSVDSSLLQEREVAVTAFGPTIAGGDASNNTTNLSFRPSVNIPAGSFLVISAISDIPDTAAVTVSDPNPLNIYEKLVGSQQPGTQTTLWLFWCLTKTAIGTNQNISIDVPNGTQIAGGALFYGGAAGVIDAITVQWDNTTTPRVSVPARAGSACLAIMGVNGPPGDTFAQDPNWSADLGAGGIGANQYRLHGGGRDATLDGPIAYAPTLGTARQVVTAVLAFK